MQPRGEPPVNLLMKETEMHASKESEVIGREDLPIFENAQSWRGPEMARRSDWIREFSADEISEISWMPMLGGVGPATDSAAIHR